MTTAELEAAVNALPYHGQLAFASRAEWDAARKERAKAITALENEWAEWLRTQYLDDHKPASATLVFNRAWAATHSEGYWAIEEYYEDLAEMLHRIRYIEDH